MGYCLNSSVAPRYLEEAAEIKVQYKDKEKIKRLSEKYPEATFVLEKLPELSAQANWDDLVLLQLFVQNKLILVIPNKYYIDDCRKHNIKFMFKYAISNWIELNSVVEAGVCQVRLAPPLTHDLEKVRNRLPAEVRIRAVPNVAYDGFFPRKDGVTGSWIRPENIEAYSKYIDIFEFEDCSSPDREQVLYDIYTRGEWPGDLNMLITNLNYPGVNRMLPPDITEKRMTCGQRCESNKTCYVCYRLLNLADPDKLGKYVDNQVPSSI